MAFGHALQDVPEIGEGLDVIELCRGNEGADGGPSLSPAVRAGEQMILAPVPTANSKRLTATANRLILAADERSLQVDLVRLDWSVPAAGCVGS